ncbi:MAG: hypothetical protein KAV97_04395 [Actinomycetia bacterium]|nr:hypothetical protein [Actinomycetes bacterium]
MRDFSYWYEIIVIAIFILIPILITTAIILSFKFMLKKRDKKIDELHEKIISLEETQSKEIKSRESQSKE